MGSGGGSTAKNGQELLHLDLKMMDVAKNKDNLTNKD